MERLKAQYNGYAVYNAGLSCFPRNFPRDSFVSGILTGDSDLLRNQLCFSAFMQGESKNSISGEEPGKIHHEYPDVELRGLHTKFNACDTTALFLISHEIYWELTGDDSLKKKHKTHIEKGVKYILSHLKNDLFIESPEFCGAKKFALEVTYWKDSEILGREKGEPHYPVIYTLAHVMNMRALRSAAKLLNRKDLEKIADSMVRALLEKLHDHESRIFYIALDKDGPIRGVSSDLLHSLFYFSPGDLSSEQIRHMAEASVVLETALGYRGLDPKLVPLVEDHYHTVTVWPFEQAVINSGARKFGLDHPVEVSERIIPLLAESDPEMFIIKDGGTVQKSECDPQLWTIAAKKYFSSGGHVIFT